MADAAGERHCASCSELLGQAQTGPLLKNLMIWNYYMYGKKISVEQLPAAQILQVWSGTRSAERLVSAASRWLAQKRAVAAASVNSRRPPHQHRRQHQLSTSTGKREQRLGR